MAAAKGVQVLNEHLLVQMYNGGSIDGERGIQGVFSEWADLSVYHESRHGQGFDVVLGPADEATAQPMAITHVVVLGVSGSTCPLTECGVFPHAGPAKSFSEYTADAAAYRADGDSCAPESAPAISVHTSAPFFNGFSSVKGAPIEFQRLHLSLRHGDVLDPLSPVRNIDLGSIIFVGYRGREQVDAALAAGAAAVPSKLPKSLGIPRLGPAAGVVNSELLWGRHVSVWESMLCRRTARV
jgi:hypothetical protein